MKMPVCIKVEVHIHHLFRRPSSCCTVGEHITENIFIYLGIGGRISKKQNNEQLDKIDFFYAFPCVFTLDYSHFNIHVTSVLAEAESVKQLRPATG